SAPARTSATTSGCTAASSGRGLVRPTTRRPALRTTNHRQRTAMKKAIITGITGQDGSYLADLLVAKGYEVHGMVRRSSAENFDRIAHLAGRVTLHQADLLDQLSIIDVFKEVRPDEVYNLGAMSFVPTSWKQPVLTGEF